MEVLTDTHCHLYFEAFDADREAVVARALEAGVRRILIPAIDLDSSRAAVTLAEQHDCAYAAIGIHPNSAATWDAASADELRTLARHPKVAAIGEIGLDYYWDKSPRYIQEQVFHYQLELAAELGLPVVVHNREATADILRMLSKWVDGLQTSRSSLVARAGVLHSFSGTLEDARQAEQIGFRIGITGPVTFKNGKDMQAVAKEINLGTLLVETDAPFLSPEPWRGTRNEPQRVTSILEAIARLREISLAEITGATAHNAALLFNW